MRTEKEILAAVIDAAMRDDGVRAVVRTDIAPMRKYLYSYAFYFIVDDAEKYGKDVFAGMFGDRVLLYRGDRNYPDMFPGIKAHLMVFRDGITLVINAADRDTFLERYSSGHGQQNVWIGDTFQKILDKDGILPDIERLEEKQTLFAEIPSEERFLGACDEFWWVMKTFAEYTLREELLSAMFYLNEPVRGLLNEMLRWYIYTGSGKSEDMGILDSNMEKLLDSDMFAVYRQTYPDADYGHIWQAFHAAAVLWSKAGRAVAERCGYPYTEETEKDMLDFVQQLRDIKVSEEAEHPEKIN